MLLERECADGLLQLLTVTRFSSKFRVCPVCKLSVSCVNVSIQASGWMQIAVTTDDFLFSQTELSLTLSRSSVSLEPQKNESLREGMCVRVLECANVGNVSLWTV